MLDSFIIDQLRRDEDRWRQPPQPWLELELPFLIPTEPAEEERGVWIIELL